MKGKEHNEDKILTDEQNRIIISPSYEKIIIDAAHKVLLHPGETHMFLTLSRDLYIPNLKKKLNLYIKTCKTFQRLKNTNSRSAELKGPLKLNHPFAIILSDLFGPFNLAMFQIEEKGFIIT